MKYFIILLTLVLSNYFYSQSPDTVIKNTIYKSFVNLKLKQPIYVKYVLKNGGGDCDRVKNHYSFKNDTGLDLIDSKNYKGSGYDKGHLANAEDFAFECKKEELTFRYYNCLPQTHNLNAGIWKTWETKIRELSHQDSLLIICGGIWKDKLVKNQIEVPSHFFKIVYSLKSNNIKYVLLFTNTKSANTCKEISFSELSKMLNYRIQLAF